MVSPRIAALVAAALLGTAALAAEPTYPPGSRIGMTPLKAMTPSKRFTGFEDAPKGMLVTFVEMPVEAYPQIAASLTPEALQAQGLTLKSRQDTKVAGRDAILVTGEQSHGGLMLKKWLLVANDPSMTAFVIAQAITGGGYSDEEVGAALKTIAIRAPLSLDDQMAALPFRLRERGGFRPVRVMAGNSLLLTDGPKDVVKENEQPLLILARSLSAPPKAEQREAFARNALFGNPTMKDMVVERAQSFRQRGADWHEIVARAADKDSGTALVVMQTIRFTPEGYLRMVGVARAGDRDQQLPRFRSVIDNVEAD